MEQSAAVDSQVEVSRVADLLAEQSVEEVSVADLAVEL